MDYDVVEVVASSSNAQKAANTLPSSYERETTENERKRLRHDDSILPQNVDISQLNKAISANNINDQNRFSLLGVLGDLEIKSVKQASTNDTQRTSESKMVPEPKKKNWCPPIFLYNVNIKELVDDLRSKIPDSSFKVKNVNRNKSKLYFADVNTHTSMMTILRSKNIKSHSFTPKELRQDSVIIRGLHSNTDVEQIKAELDVLAPETIDTISKFKTSTSIKNNIDTGLFIISLKPSKTIGDVSSIRGILNQIVSWEKPKRRSDLQCHRCQRWGHISRNCNSAYTCVKCDKQHEPGACDRVKTDTSDPFCANCKESGHPANWKGCPIYKKYAAARKERINKAIQNNATAKNNVSKAINVTTNFTEKSFANLFHQTTPKKSSIIEQFLNLAKLFLEPEELTIEQEISIFLMEYQTMSKTEAKAEFLRLLRKVKSNDP